MNIFAIIQLVMQYAPIIEKYINMGLPLIDVLKGDKTQIIPALDKLGSEMFPLLAGTIHTVTAAADALFNPHGTRWVQERLNVHGANPALLVDGVYGQGTKTAVLAFQTAHGFTGSDADGWAGPLTKKALEEAPSVK